LSGVPFERRWPYVNESRFSENAREAALIIMIARMWHGMTRAEDYDAYWKFLHERAIPDYRSTPGNLGVRLFRRLDGDRAHFLTQSYWPSLEAIRAFAGDDIDRAKYYPEDGDYLLEFEPTVQHFEVTEPDLPSVDSAAEGQR
jgi:heme-degrading monooxygenase HmoA